MDSKVSFRVEDPAKPGIARELKSLLTFDSLIGMEGFEAFYIRINSMN